MSDEYAVDSNNVPEDSIVKKAGFDDLAARFDPAKIYRGVLRRFWLVIGCGVLSALALGLVARHMKSTYVADSYIIFDSQASRSVPEGFPLGHFTMASATEMVTLPTHLNAVRSILGLDLTEQEIMEMVDVKPPVGDSNLIDVTVSAENPTLAVDIANTLASVVVKSAQDFSRRQLKATYDYLDAQIRSNRDKTDALVKEIADFRKANPNLVVSPEGLFVVRGLEETERRFQEASANYSNLLIQYENLRREVARLPDTTPRAVIEENPVKRRLAQAEMALLEAKARYAPENPKIKVIEAELRELQGALSRPQEQVAEASASPGDKNAFKEQVNLDLVNLRGKMRSAQKLKEDIEAEYKNQLTLITNLPAEQMQFARLIDQKTRLEEELKRADSMIKVADMLLKLGKGDIDVYTTAAQAYPPDSLLLNLLPLLGFFFGIGLGALLAVVLEIADSHLRTQYEVESSYNVPCAITIPEVPLLSSRNVVEKLGFYVSYIDGLVSRKLLGRERITVSLVSSTESEGKSTLAYCWAQQQLASGRKVAIVEWDPTSNSYFGDHQVAQRPLEDYLLGQASLDDVIYQQDIARIKAHDPKRVKEGLSRNQAERFLSELHARYDVVIFDSPGVLDEDYSLDLFHLADMTLYVIGSNKVKRRYVEAAFKECEQAEVRPQYIILNRALRIFIDDVRVDMANKKASSGLVKGVRSWFAGK